MARSFIISLVLLLLSGCVGPMYHVRVDSISGEIPSDEKSYILLSAKEGVNVNDLQFQEFASYIKKALSKQGFTEAQEPNSANIAIFINYGIGEPQASSYSFSLPVYGQTGGGSSSFSASTYGSGGYSTTYGNINTTPTYGVVGTQSYSGTRYTYFRYLTIESIDFNEYRKTNKIQPLWKTTVTSSGSSGDLRQVFPVLVGASMPYIGTSTGKQVKIQLHENSKNVKFVKGQSDTP